mgnify:CR=1 FL=1
MAELTEDEFDVVGGMDALESYLFGLIAGRDWEFPESFDENTTMWEFAREHLEFHGYVTIVEDASYETDVVGMDYGWFGLRLDRDAQELRAFARKTIAKEFGSPDRNEK